MRGRCLKDRRSVRRLKLLCGCLLTLYLSSGLQADAAPPAGVPWERLTTGMQVALWSPIEACPHVPSLLMLHIDPERFGSPSISIAMKVSVPRSRSTTGSNGPMRTSYLMRACFERTTRTWVSY
ncbi:MAG: hypothetical protein IPL14_01120 [Nitrospira sp.]|nr:hypothetical protein [Nitrospira sp.]